MATRWDKMTLEERFWEKVNTQGPEPEHMPGLGPCWLWVAALNEAGYGVLNRGNHRVIRAHRLSWQISTGNTLTPSQKVLHRCDNPPCVNPEHLRLGTQIENIADSVNKRRHKFGDRGAPKLCTKDVHSILDLLAAGGTHKSIAVQFGVSPSLIGLIATGKRWKHVIEDYRKAA